MAKEKRSNRSELRSLTDVEWAIMSVVWQHEPCAAGTVQEALADSRGWAYSTVKTTMDRMAAKGLLRSQSLRNLQLFSAAVTPQEVKRNELRRLLRRAFDGAMTPMLQFIVDEEGLSDKEIRELRGILDRAKRRKSP